MTRSEKFKLSIVIPVHNEEKCLPKLLSELEQHVPTLTPDYEIIFVDDASSDNTFTAVRELAQTNSHIKSLSLSRNMGHQAALACGLEAAIGDAVITMDGDLQHPPAVIPELVAKWRDGYDVVNTSRRESEDSGLADGMFSKLFYLIFNNTSRYKLTPAGADFRLLDRKCVDALAAMTEHFKFFRGMVSYIGFSQTTVTFDCPPRFAGTRSYTFVKSLRLASDGLLSFSTVGLVAPLFIGGLIVAVAIGYFAVSTVLILTGVTRLEHGWASIVALIFLSIGLQFTFLGMFGLYIGKIFIEVKRRPAYFVRETVGFDS